MTDKYIIPEYQELDEEALETINGGMFRPAPTYKPGRTGVIGGAPAGPRPTTRPAPNGTLRTGRGGRASDRIPGREIDRRPNGA